MELLFLGTGAAEGIPAEYCRCVDCNGVRERGGIEIKTRSSLRVGKHCQIDISPDHYAQMISNKTDMYDIENLLISHTHSDHFDIIRIIDRAMAKRDNGKSIRIFISAPGKNYVERLVDSLSFPAQCVEMVRDKFIIEELEYFQQYSLGEDMAFETVKGNHTTLAVGEYSINYLVAMPGGKKFLYALDTGYYTDQTWEYLDGRYTDLLIMDCTFAGEEGRGEFPKGHLDLKSFLKMLDRMSAIGFIDGRTAIYATHFNPHQGLSHFQIQERFNASPYSVIVAYDGLKVEV